MESKINIDKIGNLMILLSDKLPTLYLTKLLKLLYIIDETSISECGVPVTWLDYKVWEKGPVATDIYFDILQNNELFNKYIRVLDNASYKGAGKKIISKQAFDDSEFSDYELELVDKIISKYGSKNSDELIDILHQENSLWHKVVKEKDLEYLFKIESTSPYSIDLTERIKGEPQKMDLYNSVREMMAL